MNTRWLWVGGAVIVLAGAGFYGYSLLQTRVISDNAGIRFRSYRQIANALDTGAKPEAWDAAVFLASGMATRVAGSLKGTTFPVGGTKDKPAATLSVQSVSLAWDVGVIRAKLDLAGTYLATDTKFVVSADADFVVENVEPDPEHPDGVLLIMEPRIHSLTPGLAAPWTMIRTDRALSTLVGLGLDFGARETLTRRVPIRRAFDYSTTINQSPVVPVGDTNKLTLEVTSAGEKLHTDIIYRPIVTPAGLWALGMVTTADKANTAMDTREDITDSQKAGLDTMRTALVDRLKSYEAKPTDLAVFIGTSIFNKIAATFNALNPANRVVRVRSTAITGPLYEKKWRDDTLGDGGVFVTLTNANAVNAIANTGTLATGWDAAKGQTSLTLPINIAATVGIHVHVDPLIGGGAGVSVGMQGQAAAPLRASATVQQINLPTASGAQSGIFLVPDLACQSARMGVKTDGDLIIGPLHTSVPPIGANMSMVVGKEQMKPSPILTSLPMVYALEKPAKPKDPAAKPEPARGMQITFSGFAVNPSPAGTWIGANADFSPVLVSPLDPKALTADSLANQAEELLAKTRPSCDLKSDVEVVIGDIAIGENNDFIHAIGQISKGVQDTQRAALKAAEDAARALEKAHQDAVAAAIKAAEDAKKAADDFLKQRQRDGENVWHALTHW